MSYILHKVITSLLVLNGCKQKSKRTRGRKSCQGALMVLLSTHLTHLTCTVTSAGHWFLNMSQEHIKKEATETISSFISLYECPHPEALHAFSDKFGASHFVCSFQVVQEIQEAEVQIKKFLQRLSLVHAQVTVIFKVYNKEHSHEHVFSVKNRISVMDYSVAMDSSTFFQTPPNVGLSYCSRMHPILGDRLSLLLPQDVVEAGLCGEVNLAIVAALGPCMDQYPNWPTYISNIQVLVYSPSGIPLMHGNSQTQLSFLKSLVDLIQWEELGLTGVCSTQTHNTQEAVQCEMRFSIDENNQENETAWNWGVCRDLEVGRICPVEQMLTLFLLLQYQDPFTSQLSDFILSEEILERHLDKVFLQNEERVRSALWCVLKNTFRTFQKRKQSSKKLQFAIPVILSSVNSVVSSSSSAEFRSACMNSMKVENTFDLSVSLNQTLWGVISGRCVSSCRCTTEKVSVETNGAVGQNTEKNWKEDCPGLPSKKTCRRTEQFPLISERCDSQSNLIAADSHSFIDSVWEPPDTQVTSSSHAQMFAKTTELKNQQVERKWLQELESLSDWD